MTRNPSRERELPEQLPDARLVLGDAAVELAVRPFEVRVRDHPGPAVTRPAHVDGVEIARPDGAVHVGVHEVEPGRRAEVTEKTRLHVLAQQRLAQKRIVEQVDLADREVVRGPPVRVDETEVFAHGRGRRSKITSSASCS